VAEGFGQDIPERGGRGPVGHVPVLSKEAIEFLAVQRGGTYLDATVGLGGHSLEIARRLGAPGHLIGFDKDPAALQIAAARLVASRQSSVVSEQVPGRPTTDDRRQEWPTITLLQGSFAELANDQGPATIDGLLADLGVSSLQLEDPARGFSFQADGPLDMRMNPMSGETAEQVVNRISERELADVIYEFGEERRSRRIARAIVRSRPIHTTRQLVDVISAAARPMNRGRDEYDRRIHPATRTFQALRIFVNRELDDLKALLEAAPRVLKPGGRLVVISFHSLEDRIVKDAMREGARQGLYRLLTKKPVTASEEETDRNPRSRSAKLRAAERT
jgi:16S rRNA (cytosine1402-N4)-methyltransferase